MGHVSLPERTNWWRGFTGERRTFLYIYRYLYGGIKLQVPNKLTIHWPLLFPIKTKWTHFHIRYFLALIQTLIKKKEERTKHVLDGPHALRLKKVIYLFIHKLIRLSRVSYELRFQLGCNYLYRTTLCWFHWVVSIYSRISQRNVIMTVCSISLSSWLNMAYVSSPRELS